MKKVTLLLSTLGGAMAGYVLSNKKLREEMSNAKDAEEAARILGRALQKDGKKIAKQVQDFAESEDVQVNLQKAKSFTSEKFQEAKGELKKMMSEGGAKAKKVAKKAVKKGKAQAKKTLRSSGQAVKKAKKTAKKVSKSVKSKTKRS